MEEATSVIISLWDVNKDKHSERLQMKIIFKTYADYWNFHSMRFSE